MKWPNGIWRDKSEGQGGGQRAVGQTPVSARPNVGRPACPEPVEGPVARPNRLTERKYEYENRGHR